jgi:aspartyl-tRNA(Asn)/glutamyl-tRNA(Gln) amidotransferase subunit A
MDFWDSTVVDLAASVRRGEVTATELVEHSLGRIEDLDGSINAFTQVDATAARAAAADLDRRIAAGDDVGPLAGIPIGVKDLEDAAGYVTTYGSALHAHDPPSRRDSTHVARLKAAGCVVVGKTNTPEFGFKGVTDSPEFGHTANPWDPSRSPGGSSGGSAAAIAAGMVPLATGSDGGGSIRIPSSLCGMSGLKTSQGRVPLGDAAAPGAGTVSVRGPMARRLRDVAAVLDVVTGPDPRDVFALPAPSGPWAPALTDLAPPARVAYSRTMGFATVDVEVAAAVDAAVRALDAAGTEIVEVASVFPEDPVMSWVYIWTASRARAQGHLRDTPDWELIDPELRSQIELGLSLTAVQYAEALDACHDINLALEAAMGDADALICPTLAGRAPVLGHQGTVDGQETPSWVSFTPFVNMSRNPAATVPVGLTSDAMPIGLQVIGHQRDDLGVLRVASAVEDLVPFTHRAPAG